MATTYPVYVVGIFVENHLIIKYIGLPDKLTQ